VGAVNTVHTAPWPHCPDRNVFSDRRNSLYDMSASFRCDGTPLHSPGPAAPNALSLKVLYVGVTTHVRLAVERSRRSLASVTRRSQMKTTRRYRDRACLLVGSCFVRYACCDFWNNTMHWLSWNLAQVLKVWWSHFS